MTIIASCRAWAHRCMLRLRTLLHRPVLTPTPPPPATDQVEPSAAPVPTVPEPSMAATAPELPHKANRPHRNRAKRSAIPKPARTLGDLLAEIDVTFAALAKGVDSYDGIDRQSVAGLRKIGPSIIPRLGTAFEDGVTEVASHVDTSYPLPAIILMADNLGHRSDDEWQYPEFFFAIKCSKTPWCVTQPKKGESVYHVGFAFRDKPTTKLRWFGVYASVHPQTGEVSVTYQLVRQPVSVSGGRYMRPEWIISTWNNTGGEDEVRNKIRDVIVHHFNAWASKHEHWSTSIHKDGRRATFYVRAEEAREFFKDRDITAIAADGKRKRIIHVAHAHDRHMPDGSVKAIREHIRGVRDFTWHGYECNVTSPQFHLYDSRRFLAAGELGLVDEEPTAGMMDLSTLADHLVSYEDAGQRKGRLPARYYSQQAPVTKDGTWKEDIQHDKQAA